MQTLAGMQVARATLVVPWMQTLVSKLASFSSSSLFPARLLDSLLHLSTDHPPVVLARPRSCFELLLLLSARSVQPRQQVYSARWLACDVITRKIRDKKDPPQSKLHVGKRSRACECGLLFLQVNELLLLRSVALCARVLEFIP